MGEKFPSPFEFRRPSDLLRDIEDWFDFPHDFPLRYGGRTDVYEDKEGKNLIYETEAPGIKREDLEVRVRERDNTLKISGKSERKEEGKYYRRGRRRKISETHRLPEGADTENISSKYKDGILKVTVPLEKPLKEEKAIDIEIE